MDEEIFEEIDLGDVRRYIVSFKKWS